MSTSDFHARLQAQLVASKGTEAPSLEGEEPSLSGESMLCQVGGRRFIAFLIDLLFLVGIGRLLALLASDFFLKFGERGWWVGLAVALLFFGILDSSLTKGRTFGKWLMGIEVRSMRGEHLNFLSAFLRGVPLITIAAGFFASRFADPFDPLMAGVKLGAVLLLCVEGTFAIAHPQRRALHDLLAGSVVVRSGGIFRSEPAPVREPLIVFAVLALLILLGAGFFFETMRKREPAVRMGELSQRIRARAGIETPVLKVTLEFDQGFKPVPTFVASVGAKDAALQKDEGRRKEFARQLASELSSSAAVPKFTQRIVVVVRAGFDIGIWSEGNRHEYRFAVAEFRSTATSPTGPTIIYKVTPGGSRAKKEGKPPEEKKSKDKK